MNRCRHCFCHGRLPSWLIHEYKCMVLLLGLRKGSEGKLEASLSHSANTLKIEDTNPNVFMLRSYRLALYHVLHFLKLTKHEPLCFPVFVWPSWDFLIQCNFWSSCFVDVVSMNYFASLSVLFLVFAKFICADDFYNLLGLSRQATTRDIRKAFKKLALNVHPDKNRVADFLFILSIFK